MTRDNAPALRGRAALLPTRMTLSHVAQQAGVDSLINPWTLLLLSGAVAAAERADSAVVTREVGVLGNQTPVKWAQRLARGGRIGVIEVATSFSVDREKALRSVGLPLVLVDPIDVQRTSAASVGATNWAGGVEGTEHLIGLGHTAGRLGANRAEHCQLRRHNSGQDIVARADSHPPTGRDDRTIRGSCRAETCPR